MDITQFNYVKPELVDFNFGSAKGDDASCYVDCSTDDLCPASTDLI